MNPLSGQATAQGEGAEDKSVRSGSDEGSEGHGQSESRSRYGGWGSGSHLPQTTGDAVVNDEPTGDRNGSGTGEDQTETVDNLLTKKQKKKLSRRIIYTMLDIISGPFTALLALVPPAAKTYDGERAVSQLAHDCASPCSHAPSYLVRIRRLLQAEDIGVGCVLDIRRRFPGLPRRVLMSYTPSHALTLPHTTSHCS